jgi:hypothetical protein
MLELREEIDFHFWLDTIDRSVGRRGSAGAATYEARRRFGNATRDSEETRDVSGLGFSPRSLRPEVAFRFASSADELDVLRRAEVDCRGDIVRCRSHHHIIPTRDALPCDRCLIH